MLTKWDLVVFETEKLLEKRSEANINDEELLIEKYKELYSTIQGILRIGKNYGFKSGDTDNEFLEMMRKKEPEFIDLNKFIDCCWEEFIYSHIIKHKID